MNDAARIARHAAVVVEHFHEGISEFRGRALGYAGRDHFRAETHWLSSAGEAELPARSPQDSMI
jgi:hypothetical protein